MAKFTVYLTTTASTSIQVEAEDREEAIEKAESVGMPTICAQCSGMGGDQNLDLSDVWDVDEVCDERGNVVEED